MLGLREPGCLGGVPEVVEKKEGLGEAKPLPC